MYVRVAVNVPHVSGLFDYSLPQEMEERAVPGCLLVVPFGRQTVQAVLIRIVDEPEVQEVRPVLDLLDDTPVLTALQMALAEWLSRQSLSPLSMCLDIMLPAGLSQQSDTLYSLAETSAPSEIELTRLQERLLEALRSRGSLRGRQLEAVFSHVNWKDSIQSLVKRGLVSARAVLPPPKVHPKLVRTVQLAVDPADALKMLPEGRASAAADRRKAVIDFLVREPWPVSVSWIYATAGAKLADLQKLEELGLVSLGETEVLRDPLENVEIAPYPPPKLTNDQQIAWNQIRCGLQDAAEGKEVKPFLLHGVTGSGKTEVYLHAVEETLRLGKQVIVMVPEISLTPQTVRRFMSRFPGHVGLTHSKLSPGERYDTWRRARAGKLPVMVGPRSALFAPLNNIGLIVIDECHEETYDQSDLLPYYHAVQAALAYARLNHCVIILGSATPGIHLMFQAAQEGWNQVSLPERILAHRQVVEAELTSLGVALPALPGEGETASLPLPPVTLVDMRQELKDNNRSIISRALRTALTETLASHQQSILFLNRRGSATYVFCRDCGTVLRCPRCDLPLTYHRPTAPLLQAESTPAVEEALICHSCGYKRKMPRRCPQCTSPHIRQYGAGTEKVESEIQTMFPQARILRMDSETTRPHGAMEMMLSHFVNHRADILIGTQMLAKGLDLPLVTLVGVVLAEVGLNLPDYRAGERTFQLLTQVAGRAGRSSLGGRVIFQTFQPDHYAIQAAAAYDFDGFYNQELAYRRKLGYPPFSRLVRMEYRNGSNEKAQEAAETMGRQLQGWIEEGGFTATELIGPVPCFFSRVAGSYRWQIVLRGPNPALVLSGRSLTGWRVEVDPASLL